MLIDEARKDQVAFSIDIVGTLAGKSIRCNFSHPTGVIDYYGSWSGSGRANHGPINFSHKFPYPILFKQRVSNYTLR